MSTKSNQSFNCPNCGEHIEISDLLSDQIRSDVVAEFEKDKQQALTQALSHAEKKIKQGIQENEEKLSLELRDLKAQLLEKNQQAEQAQKQELEIRKKARTLEQKQQQMEIEMQRRLDSEKELLSTQIKAQLDQEFTFQLSKKEKQIEDLRKSVAEVKRKSEVGSQEMQGELLELNLEEQLRTTFSHDQFSPVSKGVRGADILQNVRNELQESCGLIIWEAKNAKRWSQRWIEKLKDDQRQVSASFAVLVTSSMPDSIKNFGQIDGVWVCDLSTYLGLTVALRKHLIDVAFTRQASQGKNEKVEMIYQYLSGEEFKQRIEAIVESFNSMQAQLIRERRAMEKIWKEREKQIERMANNTIGMYGEMRGIIGSGLPSIKALELDDD